MSSTARPFAGWLSLLRALSDLLAGHPRTEVEGGHRVVTADGQAWLLPETEL